MIRIDEGAGTGGHERPEADLIPSSKLALNSRDAIDADDVKCCNLRRTNEKEKAIPTGLEPVTCGLGNRGSQLLVVRT